VRPRMRAVRVMPEPQETDVVAADMFREAFRHHPAGVGVVTACIGGQPVGLAVSSLISLSADPAMVAFSVSNTSGSGSLLLEAETVVVHLLGADHVEVAKTFSTRGVDRFARTSWSYLPTGEPALDDASVRLHGRVSQQVAAGGATVIVVSVDGVDFASRAQSTGGDGLVYLNRAWFSLSPDDAMKDF
jgi:flavin reductase (DIM6/NTAB) family NADH-FMN oxidoreductase RutF